MRHQSSRCTIPRRRHRKTIIYNLYNIYNMDRGGSLTWPSHNVMTHQNPKSDLVPRYRYPGTMLRSYSYDHSLSSATWHLGPVPIPVPMVPIPMVPYPYPYPYLWSRTHTRTRTHDFVTCRTRTHTRTHGLVPVPVPIPIVSNPYPYPYPWPRTHTRTRTHDTYPHYKSALY